MDNSLRCRLLLCKCGLILSFGTPKGNIVCWRLEVKILKRVTLQNTPKGNDIWFKKWKISKIGILMYSNDHFSKTPRNPAAVFIPWPIWTCSFTCLFSFLLIGSNLITAANFCLNGKFAVVGTYDGRCIFYETEVRWVWLFLYISQSVLPLVKGTRSPGPRKIDSDLIWLEILMLMVA